MGELSQIFVAKSIQKQEENTRFHDNAFIWEELCDLFADAGLVVGFWPNSWASPDDPRIGKMQPPAYRLLIDPKNARDFLLSKPLSASITTGRTFSIWAEIFSGHRKFNDTVYLSIDDEVCVIRASYVDQVRRLAALGFAKVSGETICWHPLVIASREAGMQWERLLDQHQYLAFPVEV
ncbi:MAG: hypothetical protein ABJN26_15365 [Stappiaceae bacterium]